MEPIYINYDMELIKTYIGYIMGILGFAGIIWTYASKSASKDFNVANLKSKVEGIENKMVTKSDLKVLTDSLRLYNYRMEARMNTLVKSNNNLRNSYVNYLRRDKTLKLEDFLKFMNGIEWVVSPLEDKRTGIDSFKIQINQIKK